MVCGLISSSDDDGSDNNATTSETTNFNKMQKYEKKMVVHGFMFCLKKPRKKK